MQVPLQCVGIQGYLRPGDVTPEMMKFRLDSLASLGLPMYITEFLWQGVTSQDQLDPMLKLWIPLWFSHPALKGMLMWNWW